MQQSVAFSLRIQMSLNQHQIQWRVIADNLQRQIYQHDYSHVPNFDHSPFKLRKESLKDRPKRKWQFRFAITNYLFTMVGFSFQAKFNYIQPKKTIQDTQIQVDVTNIPKLFSKEQLSIYHCNLSGTVLISATIVLR